MPKKRYYTISIYPRYDNKKNLLINLFIVISFHINTVNCQCVMGDIFSSQVIRLPYGLQKLQLRRDNHDVVYEIAVN